MRRKGQYVKLTKKRENSMFVKLEKDERKKIEQKKEQYVEFKIKERILAENLQQKNKKNSMALALKRTKVRQ